MHPRNSARVLLHLQTSHEAILRNANADLRSVAALVALDFGAGHLLRIEGG